MASSKPAGAKALAPSVEEYRANPTAWGQKLRRSLAAADKTSVIDFAIARAAEAEALRQHAEWLQAEMALAYAEVFLAHGPTEAEQLADHAKYPNITSKVILQAAKEKRGARQTAKAREFAADKRGKTKLQRAQDELLKLSANGENIMGPHVTAQVAKKVGCDVKHVRTARTEILSKR